MSPESSKPLDDSLPAKREGQHRNGSAERVGERQEGGVDADAVGGSDDGNRRQDRPCTGHEDKAETQAEQENARDTRMHGSSSSHANFLMPGKCNAIS